MPAQEGDHKGSPLHIEMIHLYFLGGTSGSSDADIAIVCAYDMATCVTNAPLGDRAHAAESDARVRQVVMM